MKMLIVTIIIIILLLASSCTQIIYSKQDVLLKVNHFFVNPKYVGFKWRFSDGSWVEVSGFDSETNIEILKLLNTLTIIP